ncbi:TetR family transcriptional regulator C-terminal domain-containing protein [Mangrovicoccus algicola]|uniref:TetR family transcriptional regulator C-terminal domain-containing protein n=1 Tax=Mangrovicoccus algicola TaxID=2771008 RepID=A0A8J6Z083_9RHOB|nr:TetR family transcriptional regulator C-terminal domain-containing protein [Mangrovicoccus algicola]MBE3640099.1 TetR family transcriptional regulator C-terminal domain-containing protein [Mangrovicoccus algicola]
MTRASSTRKPTRNQIRKRREIFEAALDTFSEHGLRGATLEQIAAAAGLSKQNVIYYFDGKEAIYRELLESLLDRWLAPLRALSPEGEPVAEILTYMRRKLEMSRDMPRESRLFATEILRGAPLLREELQGGLRALVDEKAAVIAGWAAAGRIAPVDPHHLIFSIWAMSQHYADFDIQVCAVLGAARSPGRFDEAGRFLETALMRMLGHDGPEFGQSAAPVPPPDGNSGPRH